MVVISIGVASMMLTASGFAAVWGGEPPQTDAAVEQVNSSAEKLNPENKPVSGPLSNNDGSTVGLLSSGLDGIINFVSAVVHLQSTLVSIGWPAWAALPLQIVGVSIAGIGFVEFVLNREWD